MYGTHCLELIHIALKFHQAILYGYLVIALTRECEKNNQREVTWKYRKQDQSFLYVTHCRNIIHIAIKFHRYSIQLHTYGTHKVSQKFHQSRVTHKLRKREQSFMNATHPLNLIHIAITFHKDILYGNLLMVRIRSVNNLIKGK